MNKKKYLYCIVILLLIMGSCDKSSEDETSFKQADIQAFFSSHYFDIPPKEIQVNDLKMVESITNKTIFLKNVSADIIILNFWATWCKPCLVEMPEMDQLQKALENQNIKIIAVNYGDSEDRVDAFQKKHNYSFLITRADQKQIQNDFQVKGLPTTFLLSKQGKILARLVGPAKWGDESYIVFFKKLKKYLSEV